MGFYGNMANVDRSTFQFDKIYGSRTEMEKAITGKDDGVFVGRYVLVDYDQMFNYSTLNTLDQDILTHANFKLGYEIVDQRGDIEVNSFHTGPSINDPKFIVDVDNEYDIDNPLYIRMNGLMILLGKVTVRQPNENEDQNVPFVEDLETFESNAVLLYKCTNVSEEIDSGIPYAYFTMVDPTDVNDAMAEYFKDANLNTYVINYNQDQSTYGYKMGRGWDSTVWQKTYANGKSTYVMVAELNSVVPTFGITVDAPTETPINPHFGGDITNIYYPLHVQPSWGMRIKSRYQAYRSIDPYQYPSDVHGSFVIDSRIDSADGLVKLSAYNGEDGPEANEEYSDDVDETMPLAIFFNKAGFDPYKGSNAIVVAQNQMANLNTIATYFGNDTEIQQKDPNYWTLKDSIQMRPTGKSLNYYNVHKADGTMEMKQNLPDTYELSIMLPSIGQIMSDVWDLVFGTNRYLDIKGRPLWHKQTGLFATAENTNSYVRNANFEWDTHNGLRGVYDQIYSEPRLTNGILKYDKNALSTLVGSINTAHDLIGMTIRNYEDLNLNTANTWDPTKIYYINGAFYKKQKAYNYTANSTTKYQQVNMIDLSSGNYFREDWGQFPAYEDDALTDVTEKKYIDYIKASNDTEYIDGAIYGTIVQNGEEQEISAEGYEPNKYYYPNAGTPYQFTLDQSASPSGAAGMQYYEIDIQQVSGFEFYVPNRYYVSYVDNEGLTVARRCTEETLHAIINSDDSDKVQGYTFYRDKVEGEIGGSISQGQDRYEWVVKTENGQPVKAIYSPIPIPPSNYINKRENDFDIKYTDDQGNEVILETIPAANINKDSNGVWLSYKTYKYQIEGAYSIPQYKSTFEFVQARDQGSAFNFYYDENNHMVPEYEKIRRKIPDSQSYSFEGVNPVRLVEFTEPTQVVTGEFFGYFYADNPITLPDGTKKHAAFYQETVQQLKTTTDAEKRNTLKDGVLLYYKIKLTPCEVFYDLKNGFYYLDKAGNWRRETLVKTASAEGIEYYPTPTFTPISNNTRVFTPNTYYTKSGDVYTLASTYTAGTTYYEKVGPYVVSDSNHIFERGMEWNENHITKPESVTLGSRTPYWTYKKLDGYCKDLNTLNGYVIKANELLQDHDFETRDRRTVQGSINRLNDLIEHFDKLVPGQLVLVDEYGRIHSATWTDDDWLNLTVSTNYSQPTLSLEHGFTAVTDTVNTADKNGNGDTIELYVPKVDGKGHVVGKTTTTVTLPYGFKTVSIGAASTAVTNSTPTAADLIAGNTQDTVSISPSNKWINLVANATNKSFTIGHQVNSITTTANPLLETDQNDLVNNTVNDTIDIPDWTYDEAGHITSKISHTYTLPYGFKTFKFTNSTTTVTNAPSTINNNGLIAGNTQDELTFTGSNKWILFDNNTSGTAKIGHLVVHDSTLTKGDSTAQTPNFGSTFKALYAEVDQAGHITALSDHDITIPKGSLTDAAANGADVITQLTFTDTSGALATTRANIGGLLLTGYNGAASGENAVAATDSLNAAIGKLQGSINSIGTNLTTLNTTVTNSNATADATKTAVNGSQARTASITGAAFALQSIVQVEGAITDMEVVEVDPAGTAASAASDAITTVVGTNTDTGTADTIYGAKAYAAGLDISNKSITKANAVPSMIDPSTNQPITTMTLSDMLAKIEDLENRLATLENASSSSNSEPETPEPNPEEPGGE